MATENMNSPQMALDNGRRNAHLEAILRSSADAITTMTPDGIILGWSAGAEAMFGYTAAEMIGRSIKSAVFSAEAQGNFQVYDIEPHGEGVTHHEAIRMRRDGTPVEVALTVCPIDNEDGKLAALSVIYHDRATERRLETSFNSAQSMIRQLVETSPFGIYAIDADFRLIHVGIGARKAFANIEPLIGRDMGDLFRILWPEPFASELIGHFRTTLETGVSFRSENTVHQRANIDEIEAYDWKVERINMPDGRFGLVCHFYDFSERQALESSLREREDRLRLTMDVAEIGAWTQDLDTGCIEWNEHACRILEIDPSTEGQSLNIWGERTHPEDLAKMQAIYHEAIAQGRAYHGQHRIFLPSGVIKWLDIHGRLLPGQNELKGKITGVFADITDRVRSEEQIRLLMGEVNHRAKNLLAVVLAIGHHTAKDPAEKAYADRLSSRIMALSASQDLMRVSEREGIDVAALVEAQLCGFDDEGGTRIRFDGPTARLAPAAAQTIGMALHELATNATKYGALSNDSGGVSIAWSINDGKSFSMQWSERAGPPVTPPVKHGFGKMVIVNMVESALQAAVALDYTPEGMSWRFNAPMSRVIEAV